MQVLICVAKRVAGTCRIWTLQEQNRIQFPCCKKGSPGALFLEQLRLMGPGRYRRRHICRGPGDALALRSYPLLARSLPVKWLTLKINSVISNKLFFLFLPLSISSGDRFLLVAISFHNTVEWRMHNVKDVKKMNALSNASALGRLIRKIRLYDWPKCSGRL